MRISDWSSDVCSSDLARGRGVAGPVDGRGSGAGLELADEGHGEPGGGAVVPEDGLRPELDPRPERPDDDVREQPLETGRESGRERVSQYVLISVVAV